MKLFRKKEGFTLIELLIVIAIVAVLSVVVVIALNPAELLKITRDSGRLRDLYIINRALRLQEVDVANSYFGSSSVVYVSVPDDDPECDTLSLPPLSGGWQYSCKPSSTYRMGDGSGWVPVNFGLVTFKPLFSAIPVDPINTASSGYYYTYIPGGSWELNALLESQKYQADAQKDGGDVAGLFEVGNDLVIAPPRGSSSSTVNVSSTSPSNITQGSTGTIVTVTGSNFAAGATVSFSSTDLTVTNTNIIDSSTIQVTVNVKESISSGPGLRNVTVTNLDSSFGTGNNLLTVDYNPGLKGYWRMNEGSGSTISDTTGNNSNGSFINSPAWFTSNCQEGNCLGFNGTNSYVDTPHSSAIDFDSAPFSISLWVYPTSTPSGKDLLIKNNQYRVLSNSTNIRLIDNFTGAGLTVTTTLPLYTWTHVALVILSNTSGTAYINGSPLSTSWVLTWAPSSTSALSLKIPNTTSFAGRLDDVRLYNQALSSTQVQEIYNAGN